MEPGDLKIICYTGGTCGDLVTAVIDPTGATLNQRLNTVTHTAYRTKLKKPHLFFNNDEKLQYLGDIKSQYQSIPSHDLDFHVSKKHDFISITVQDKNIALWAAERFKNCHRPHVWEEMQRVCGANSVDDYADILIHYSTAVKNHTNKLIQLEDILAGKLIESLELGLSLTISEQGKDFYHSWISVQ